MSRRWSTAIQVLGVTLMLAAAADRAHAAVIHFETMNLHDSVVGEDLWQYRYFVSDDEFLENRGFTIFFGPAYSSLESPPPFVNADWDVLTIQPDPTLPDSGFYDAAALADAASLVDAFVLSFVWHGPGDPGSQSFDINQLDAAGNFVAVIESGQTIPLQAVPEPATLLFVAAGVAMLGARRRSTGR